MKKCKKCGLEKDRSLFRKQTVAKDGLQSHCKQCREEFDSSPICVICRECHEAYNIRRDSLKKYKGLCRGCSAKKQDKSGSNNPNWGKGVGQKNKDKMVELRMEGLSVPDIAIKLGVSKSTVMAQAGDIPLQRPKIFASAMTGPKGDAIRGKISIANKRWALDNRTESLAHMALAKDVSNRAFTEHEKSLLPKLELLYDT